MTELTDMPWLPNGTEGFFQVSGARACEKESPVGDNEEIQGPPLVPVGTELAAAKAPVPVPEVVQRKLDEEEDAGNGQGLEDDRGGNAMVCPICGFDEGTCKHNLPAVPVSGS